MMIATNGGNMTVSARSVVFSLSDDLDLSPLPPGAASDAAPAIFRGDAAQHSGFVHRITAAGAILTMAGPVARGARGAIELPFGIAAQGAFEHGFDSEDAGAGAFRFDAPLDVVGALARCLAALPAERRQIPRIELRQRLCIRHGDQVDFAWLRNLSPSGAGIETRAPLQVGEAVEVTLDGLRPLNGEIRWAEQGMAGIAFVDELGWQLLMPWLRKISQGRAAAAPTDDMPSALRAVKNALRLNMATQVRSGASWWNAQLNSLSNALVEFESATQFAPLSSLWLSLPEIGGWPIRVVECHGARHVAEFRVPLRPHEMARLSEGVRGKG
jgi:hypothetical protein